MTNRSVVHRNMKIAANLRNTELQPEKHHNPEMDYYKAYMAAELHRAKQHLKLKITPRGLVYG